MLVQRQNVCMKQARPRSILQSMKSDENLVRNSLKDAPKQTKHPNKPMKQSFERRASVMWLRGHRATDLAGSTTTDAMGLVLMLLMLLRVRRGSRVHGVCRRAPIVSESRVGGKGGNFARTHLYGSLGLVCSNMSSFGGFHRKENMCSGSGDVCCYGVGTKGGMTAERETGSLYRKG